VNLDFLQTVAGWLGAERYSQHAICLTNDPIMLILYVSAYGATALSYFTIGWVLVSRRVHIVELTPTAYVLYGSFIVLCGLAHSVDVLVLFTGVYRLHVVVLVAMATVSSVTAALTVYSVYGPRFHER
jgi:hypothetical protein